MNQWNCSHPSHDGQSFPSFALRMVIIAECVFSFLFLEFAFSVFSLENIADDWLRQYRSSVVGTVEPKLRLAISVIAVKFSGKSPEVTECSSEVMDFRTGGRIIKSRLWWNWGSAWHWVSSMHWFLKKEKEKEKEMSVVDWQGWIAELIGHMCGFVGAEGEGINNKKSDNCCQPCRTWICQEDSGCCLCLS